MRTRSSGFTLVEVLVISPIVILFIGTFIALLVNLTGESLVIRERNMAIHDSQAALDDIQASITQATGFLTATGPLQSPQGKNNLTAEFTDTTSGQPDALIMKLAATNKSPNDSTRSLIYTGAGTCDSKNPIYTYYTIYFVAPDADTADPTDNALFKRTILPQVSACAVPWQRPSCADAVKASNPTTCKRSDEKLVGGVASMDVKYYTGNSVARDNDAPTATDVSVNLSVSKQIAGSTVDYASSVRATSLNVQSAEAGVLTASTTPNPPVTWSRTASSPYNTTVTWNSVGNAASYTVKYRIGGGAEQTTTVSQSGTPPPTYSTTLSAGHRKQTVQLVDIVVNTASGGFSYGSMPAISSIPNWNDCQFSGQGGWNNYDAYYPGGPYTRAGFTKTSSKIVGLKGLVKGTTLNVPICNLPVGFRPKFAGEKLIFQTAACCSNWGRIDIHANGDVVPVQGNTEWFSLDGIMFIADDSNYTWSTLGWQNGWNNYNTVYGGTGHSTLRTTVDSEGRRHVQGLGGYSGTAPNGFVMTNPGGVPVNGSLHYPAMSNGPGIVQYISPTGNIVTRSSPVSYQSLQMMFLTSAVGGQQAMPFSSGWHNYDVNTWPSMRCHRGSDDIIVVQGLIAHNGAADGNGTYIGDTGPCGRFSSGEGVGVRDRLILSPWLSNETPGRIDMINGVSLLSQGTQDPWTALDGIHFIAD